MMKLNNLTKPIYLFFLLSIISISAQSAVVKWNIEFSEPITEGSLESHVTGQGTFAYDTSTASSVTITDDAFQIPIYGLDNNGVPYIIGYDFFTETKNEINTLLTDLTINNLGIEWGLNDISGWSFPLAEQGEWWWKDNEGAIFHDAGSKIYAHSSPDSGFVTNGWEFEKFGNLDFNLFINLNEINSSTALGTWSQNTSSNKSQGTWSAQVITTPIPGAFYLFASGIFSLIHLARKTVGIRG